MIHGVHALIYAHDAVKARAFLRDVLGWPHVDAGHGWLIFEMPPSEIGVHPMMEGESYSHHLYLMCKDIKKTVAKLEKKGVQCAPVQDAGFGLLTSFELPGAGPLGLYEPRHPLATGLAAKAAKNKAKKPTSSPARKHVGKKKPASNPVRKRGGNKSAALKKKPTTKKPARRK